MLHFGLGNYIFRKIDLILKNSFQRTQMAGWLVAHLLVRNCLPFMHSQTRIRFPQIESSIFDPLNVEILFLILTPGKKKKKKKKTLTKIHFPFSLWMGWEEVSSNQEEEEGEDQDCKMLQRAASNACSWWWASHIRTKQSKWLEQSLQGRCHGWSFFFFFFYVFENKLLMYLHFFLNANESPKPWPMQFSRFV